FTFAKCSDYENNRYKVVKIGTQLWMAENLKSGYYSNGTPIPYVNTVATWDALTATDKAFCYYDDNTANGNIYGALYTWPAAMNGAAASSTSPSNVQGACPTGWHLPSDAEWHSMILVIDPGAQYSTTESSFAGGMLKEMGTSHWSAPNAGAADTYGFGALPSGRRVETGLFTQLSYNAMWWTTTDASGNARDRTLYYTFERIDRAPAYKNVGYAIRCVRNN
nr:fibrobacter succinogenes major paralogous domain-containing protein [Bacteroidales bacterium]